MNTAESVFGQEPNKEERIETSPTIEHILEGKAGIKLLSEGSESREVEGVKYNGTVYSYELEVPSFTNPSETWVTELSV